MNPLNNPNHYRSKAMLLHQFIRTSRIIIKSNLRMRGPLLRNICRDLDARKDLLRRLLGVAIEGSRRRQILQIVVVAGAVITSADDRGKNLRVAVACVWIAPDSRGSCGLAAVAVASGGENVWQEPGEESACAWETGANDCYVALDGGPGCRADVVV
jgi:hypothetical protein